METRQAAVTEQAIPLCVDLDGTVLKTDLLFESLASLARHRPASLFLVPFWLLKGRAAMKREVASRVRLNLDTIPVREELVDYLRSERLRGRKVVLVTASDSSLANKLA